MTKESNCFQHSPKCPYCGEYNYNAGLCPQSPCVCVFCDGVFDVVITNAFSTKKRGMDKDDSETIQCLLDNLGKNECPFCLQCGEDIDDIENFFCSDTCKEKAVKVLNKFNDMAIKVYFKNLF